MMLRAGLAVLLFSTLCAAPAYADRADRDCKFSHRIEEISRVGDLPAGIQADLPSNMADRGGAFAGGDVIAHGIVPSFGLWRAGHAESAKGRLWFVIYSGSMLPEDVRFYKADSGSFLYFRPEGTQHFDNVCKQFDALLASGPP